MFGVFFWEATGRIRGRDGCPAHKRTQVDVRAAIRGQQPNQRVASSLRLGGAAPLGAGHARGCERVAERRVGEGGREKRGGDAGAEVRVRAALEEELRCGFCCVAVCCGVSCGAERRGGRAHSSIRTEETRLRELTPYPSQPKPQRRRRRESREATTGAETKAASTLTRLGDFNMPAAARLQQRRRRAAPSERAAAGDPGLRVRSGLKQEADRPRVAVAGGRLRTGGYTHNTRGNQGRGSLHKFGNAGGVADVLWKRPRVIGTRKRARQRGLREGQTAELSDKMKKKSSEARIIINAPRDTSRRRCRPGRLCAC